MRLWPSASASLQFSSCFLSKCFIRYPHVRCNSFFLSNLYLFLLFGRVLEHISLCFRPPLRRFNLQMCFYEKEIFSCGHHELGDLRQCQMGSKCDKRVITSTSSRQYKCKACRRVDITSRSDIVRFRNVSSDGKRFDYFMSSQCEDPGSHFSTSEAGLAESCDCFATQSISPSGGLQESTTRPLNIIAQRHNHLSKAPLQNLLARYYTIDAISQCTPERISHYLDLVSAEPPSRPLARSLANVFVNTPRPWLGICGMIRNLHTDVLQKVLSILSDAQICTGYVLHHTPDNPILPAEEQELASQALLQSVRARKLVLNMLQRKIQAYVATFVARSQKTTLDLPPLPHIGRHRMISMIYRRLQSEYRRALTGASLLNNPKTRGESSIRATMLC